MWVSILRFEHRKLEKQKNFWTREMGNPTGEEIGVPVSQTRRPGFQCSCRCSSTHEYSKNTEFSIFTVSSKYSKNTEFSIFTVSQFWQQWKIQEKYSKVMQSEFKFIVFLLYFYCISPQNQNRDTPTVCLSLMCFYYQSKKRLVNNPAPTESL